MICPELVTVPVVRMPVILIPVQVAFVHPTVWDPLELPS